MYTAAALDTASDPTCTFAPSHVRYIKLGSGGAWAEEAFDRHALLIGFDEVPAGLCEAGDWNAVRVHLAGGPYAASTITNWVRELHDFYTLGPDTLWCTVADGHLHWAFAEPEVITLPDGPAGRPRRMRRVIGGWRRTDLSGAPLTTRSLSSALLRTAGYRMTICKVEREDYLQRRIRGEVDPLNAKAIELKSEMRSLTVQLIQQLDWRDFEILVDLVLTRGGWQRGSAIGTGETDVDLLLTHPSTGETAWVQVKSKATQAVLDDYVGRFQRDGSCQRFFFVCHSAAGKLTLPPALGFHLWSGPSLAEAVIAAGLFDWLIDRSR